MTLDWVFAVARDIYSEYSIIVISKLRCLMSNLILFMCMNFRGQYAIEMQFFSTEKGVKGGSGKSGILIGGASRTLLLRTDMNLAYFLQQSECLAIAKALINKCFQRRPYIEAFGGPAMSEVRLRGNKAPSLRQKDS